MSETGLRELQRQFTDALPAMMRRVAFRTRHVMPSSRAEELRAEAVALLWHWWRVLADKGRAPALIANGMAHMAGRAVLAGRRLGPMERVRDAMTTDTEYRRLNKGTTTADAPARQELTAEDWRWSSANAGPCALVADRLDYAAWLETLTPRDRLLAFILADGATGQRAAEVLGMSAPWVSIRRAELRASWEAFTA